MVLDAVIELFERGVIEPAVEEVSSISGVSTRSLYRYFGHREGLIDAAMWHLVEREESSQPLDLGEGTLEQRVATFVNHRLEMFRRVAPIVRATKRLSRPATLDQPRVADPPIFSLGPSTAFAAEFGAVDPSLRRVVEAIADMAFQFESLDFLMQTFEFETPAVAAVLQRHLHQQLDPINIP